MLDFQPGYIRMLYYLIPILISLALIVHVAKTGRNQLWIYLFVFTVLNPVTSVICWLAYFIVEILPELMGSRTVQRAASGLRKTVDPHRDLREANRKLAVNDSVDSRRKLADQLLDRGRYDEAIEHYRAGLTGIYSHEPLLMLGVAKAQFALGQYSAARATLDELIAHNPDFKSADGHLIYARCLEEEGNIDKAISEYAALSRYYSGAEAMYRHAALLKRQGRVDEAQAMFRELLAQAETAGVLFRRDQKEWIDAARRELGA